MPGVIAYFYLNCTRIYIFCFLYGRYFILNIIRLTFTKIRSSFFVFINRFIDSQKKIIKKSIYIVYL
jgi:hypothetical protein